MVEFTIPLDILDDLSSRFIINVPEEERKDLVRICFQMELAHWFYLDFYCSGSNRKLKTCGIKEFANQIFHHIPFLQPHVAHIDSVIEQWQGYKQSVPTFGAIVLNEDLTKVLLVRSYWAKNSWSFPKGKVNEDEDPSHCAVREVFEETGFDISNLIDKNDYIESTIQDQLVRLYIISGVQMSTKFKPRTRKEIKNVEWFLLADLPNNRKDTTPKLKMGVRPNALFMVVPFVKRIKRWVAEKQQREKNALPLRRHRHKSLSDVESTSKIKRQQQLFSESAQTEISDVLNAARRLNTSPPRSRRSPFDVKSSQKIGLDSKNVAKGTFKRNLFGELDEDQSAAILAKQLSDSPRCGLPPILHPTAVQPKKCKEFNVTNENSSKTKDDIISGNKESSVEAGGNIKSLLFGEAAQKLSSDINDIPSPFGTLQHGKQSPFVRKTEHKAQKLSLEFNSKIWTNFKFDRQAVLNCFKEPCR